MSLNTRRWGRWPSACSRGKAAYMDLLERGLKTDMRHPWETARVDAILKLLAPLRQGEASALDVGCGDGYVVHRMHERLRLAEAVAQDTHLTDTLIAELSRPGVTFVRQLSELGERRFDIVTLLDVLEHIDEPGSLLCDLVRWHMTSETWVLVTVPAFQRLFTQHDRDLKHVRRYSLSELTELLETSGLEVRKSGYLFSSLLLPRALSVLKEAIRKPKPRASVGLANFSAPRWVARALYHALALDNRVCLWSRQHGITLPGLSAWALCKPK